MFRGHDESNAFVLSKPQVVGLIWKTRVVSLPNDEDRNIKQAPLGLNLEKGAPGYV